MSFLMTKRTIENSRPQRIIPCYDIISFFARYRSFLSNRMNSANFISYRRIDRRHRRCSKTGCDSMTDYYLVTDSYLLTDFCFVTNLCWKTSRGTLTDCYPATDRGTSMDCLAAWNPSGPAWMPDCLNSMTRWLLVLM
jgi:hypothetical protein